MKQKNKRKPRNRIHNKCPILFTEYKYEVYSKNDTFM